MTRAQSKPLLAIDGGNPVRTAPMPGRQAIGAAEQAKVAEVFSFYAEQGADPGYQGHFEALYCNAFEKSQGGGFADAVATGTAALFVALAALNLPEGSEVIVSPITDPGSINAIILNRLVPKLADSAPGSYNMDVDTFTARITDKTSAVMVVHAAGRAAKIDAITESANERGMRVIEDCSQAHGACLNGRPVGTFGDIAAFSAMHRKAHVMGGSGGVVFTRDEALYHQTLAHADRGKPRWSSDFDDRDPTGYLFPALNLHSDEISCAIGLSSLGRLPETRRRRLAYLEMLDVLSDQTRVCRPYGWTQDDSPFFYPVIVDGEALNRSKQEFAEAVRAEGIDLNPHYMYVVAEWPWAREYLADGYDCPNARQIRDASFNLYLNENYGQQEVADTIAAIKKVEDAFA